VDYDKFMKELNRWCFWMIVGFCTTFFGSIMLVVGLPILICCVSASMQAEQQQPPMPKIEQQVSMPVPPDYNQALEARPRAPSYPPCGRSRLPTAEEIHNRRTVVVEDLNF
jgi:hypothetical protein